MPKIPERLSVAGAAPGSAARWKALNRFRVAHLATADADGQPLVVPVCFVCANELIYSVVDEKPKRVAAGRLRRVRNIQQNPRVSLVADHYEEDWARLTYILLEGTAEVLSGGDEHHDAVRRLRRKYPQYRNMQLDDKPVIKISPHRVRSWKAAGI